MYDTDALMTLMWRIMVFSVLGILTNEVAKLADLPPAGVDTLLFALTSMFAFAVADFFRRNASKYPSARKSYGWTGVLMVALVMSPSLLQNDTVPASTTVTMTVGLAALVLLDAYEPEVGDAARRALRRVGVT